MAGTVLGFYPVRVLPSKTAIAPVNPTFLPRVSILVHCIEFPIALIKLTAEFDHENLTFLVQDRLILTCFAMSSSLRMKGKCAQELSTAQILIRR